MRVLMMGSDRAAYIVCLGTALLLVIGCSGMNLHDPGRLKAASEATELTKQFGSDGGAIFTPMEENLDSFASIEQKIVELANAHELETFTVILAGESADDVGRELLDKMTDWSSNITAFDNAEKEAVKAVNAALDRQDVVAMVLTTKEKTNAGGEVDRSLEDTINRLKERLDTMDKNAKLFLAAFDKVAGLSGGGSSDAAAKPAELSSDAEDNVKKVETWIKRAQSILGTVEKDEQLVAARALLAATIQEQLASEARRITEYRRYLGEIKRLRQTFDIRERVAVCHLFLPAFYRLLPGLTDRTDLVAVYDDFKTKDRYTKDDFCAFAKIRDVNGEVVINKKGQEDWNSGQNTLAEYTAANVKRLKRNAQGPTLAIALGILGFVERPFLDQAVNQLYLEANRHSLRLSRINAQQRADLLRALASSIEIYEQGGIKLEEVARLALFASQVGALFFIGSQQ